MFKSMKPEVFHRILAPDNETILVLTWPQPKRSARSRFREALMGGESPDSPRSKVSASAFRTCLKLLEGGDVEGAIEAFGNLGYKVSTHKRTAVPH